MLFNRSYLLRGLIDGSIWRILSMRRDMLRVAMADDTLASINTIPIRLRMFMVCPYIVAAPTMTVIGSNTPKTAVDICPERLTAFSVNINEMMVGQTAISRI